MRLTETGLSANKIENLYHRHFNTRLYKYLCIGVRLLDMGVVWILIQIEESLINFVLIYCYWKVGDSLNHICPTSFHSSHYCFLFIFLDICVLCESQLNLVHSGLNTVGTNMNVERVESFRTSLMTQKTRLLKQTQAIKKNWVYNLQSVFNCSFRIHLTRIK